MKSQLSIGRLFAFLFLVSLILSSLFYETLGLNHNAIHADSILQPPSKEFFLGTDSLGRDFLARVIFSARYSLIIGVVSSLIATVIGTLIGILISFQKGFKERILLSGLDIFTAIPDILLLIVFSLIFSRLQPLIATLLTMSCFNLYVVARTVRSELKSLMQRPYIESAHATGAGLLRILVFHIGPQLRDVILTLFLVQIPATILYESYLSFLGLGVQPPNSSWGLLANEGWLYLRSQPYLCLVPSLCIFLISASINEIIAMIRKSFDPLKGNYLAAFKA